MNTFDNVEEQIVVKSALGIPFAMLVPMFGAVLLVGAVALFLFGRYARA